jgi:hypothetical protein
LVVSLFDGDGSPKCDEQPIVHTDKISEVSITEMLRDFISKTSFRDARLSLPVARKVRCYITATGYPLAVSFVNKRKATKARAAKLFPVEKSRLLLVTKKHFSLSLKPFT